MVDSGFPYLMSKQGQVKTTGGQSVVLEDFWCELLSSQLGNPPASGLSLSIVLSMGQGQEFLPTATAKKHLGIPVLLTLSPVRSCPSHLDNPTHPGSATVAVPGKTGDKTPAKSLRVF